MPRIRSSIELHVVVRHCVNSLGCLTLICSACGTSTPSIDKKPTFPAKGKVLLEEKVLANAIVTLHPEEGGSKAIPAYGKTDNTGVFVLSTYDKDDGAPAGRYGVTVLLQQGEEGVTLLPLRYTDPKKSGLTAEIQAGLNELPPLKLQRQ